MPWSLYDSTTTAESNKEKLVINLHPRNSVGLWIIVISTESRGKEKTFDLFQGVFLLNFL